MVENNRYDLSTLVGRVTFLGFDIMRLWEVEWQARQFRVDDPIRRRLLKEAREGYKNLLEGSTPLKEPVRDYLEERILKLSQPTKTPRGPPGYSRKKPKPKWRKLFLPLGHLQDEYHGDVLKNVPRGRFVDGLDLPGGLEIPTFNDDLIEYYRTHPTMDEPLKGMFLERIPTELHWQRLVHACEEMKYHLVKDLVFGDTQEFERVVYRITNSVWACERTIFSLRKLLEEHELYLNMDDPEKR